MFDNQHATVPNQALKLTRLSGCLLGGHAFGDYRAVQWRSPPPAVQLSASVGPLDKALT